jgi:DNA modification methylase
VFYLNYAEDIGLKYNILVWRKPNNVINKDRFSSSIEYIIRIYDTENAGLNRLQKNEYYDKVKEISRYIQKDEKVHHTQKPIELVTQFVELSSLENNVLFEPFTGSGTTMVASHQLKRKCYGMELDPKYCQVIVDRMMKLDPSLEVKRNGIKYIKTTE